MAHTYPSMILKRRQVIVNVVLLIADDFCRQTYKDVIAMPGGKIIWSYVKPLLRGQILYAPNTVVISEVMALTNETFVQMDHLSTLVNSLEKTLKSLASLSEMGDTLNELQSILASDVMKVAVKSMGGNFEGTVHMSTVNF